jgi:hypothetical protein
MRRLYSGMGRSVRSSGMYESVKEFTCHKAIVFSKRRIVDCGLSMARN